MKEACSNRGAPLKKDDLIISTDGSKAGDKDFYETAMKEYNKEKHDEYDTLHFADDIVVDDKNLPKVFNPIKNWRDLKKVFNETTAELDKIRQQSMLSGRNGSDSEGETDGNIVTIPKKSKTYIQYWNLFANQDPERFRKLNRELPDGVFFQSGTKKKTGVATRKKKKNGPGNQLVAALDRGTDLEYDRFKEEKKHGRTLTKMFKIDTMAKKVDAISKLTKQRDDIEERKEKKIKTTIGYMPGDTQRDQYSAFRKRRKDHKIRKINRGGTKDPLTQDSLASDFDEIEEFDERKKNVLERIEIIEKMGEDIDDDDDDDGENNNKTGNSKDDAIAID
jgi:hypothetical protein